jgi:hypothetical protein
VGERDYFDRIDPQTYANDEPIHFWIQEDVAGARDVWIPERIWYRIVNVGRAYDLHLLPLSLPNENDHVFFNGQQSESLVDELEFVASILEDELVRDAIVKLQPFLTEARRHKGMGIEGP